MYKYRNIYLTILIIFLISLLLDNEYTNCYSKIPLWTIVGSKDPGLMYKLIIKNKVWNKLIKFKKHKAVAHCSNYGKDSKANLLFRRNWANIGGIYKITYLPFKLFSYYGSTKNFAQRFKYHNNSTPKNNTLLGLFIRTFGWKSFSMTIVEIVEGNNNLSARENWYLNTFKPLLNTLTKTGQDFRLLNKHSLLTKIKISAAALSYRHSIQSKLKISQAHSGINNVNFGRPLPNKVLDAAAEKLGTKIYVYDVKSLTLLNGTPFRSIRLTAKILIISPLSIVKYIDSGKPFKGYYFYSKPLSG